MQHVQVGSNQYKKRVLEIINDDDEDKNRASSNDIGA